MRAGRALLGGASGAGREIRAGCKRIASAVGERADDAALEAACLTQEEPCADLLWLSH
jgi:hypothetical protein